ncbi:hypothetical protein JYT28_00655 [Desulfobulbus sp. AH-315-M07]|nr:hypothetical protein [Desulfobulbus sp. AH-315-M07]
MAALVVGGCSNDWDLLDPRLVGEGGVGAGKPTGCGSIRVLAADFAGEGVPTLWGRSQGNGEAKTEGGELVLQLPTSGTDGGYANITTHRRYDLVQSEISVELLEIPEQGQDTSLSFQLRESDWNRIRFLVQGGTLFAEARVNTGDWVPLASAAIDLGAHRWWRFRDDGASTYWETAAAQDGPWNVFASLITAAMFPLDYLEVQLAASAGDGLSASAGRARFDNVNGGVETEPRCKISTFTDDFEDGIRDIKWRRFVGSESASAVEYLGELAFSLPAGAAGANYQYISARGYDLQGEAVVVRFTGDLAAALTSTAYLGLEHDGANDLSIRVKEGKFIVVVEQDNTEQEFPEPTGLDPAVHRWWRIREEGGTTFFEVSENASDWLELSSLSLPFPLDRMDVRLGVFTEDALASTAVVKFDNFNLSPL